VRAQGATSSGPYRGIQRIIKRGGGETEPRRVAGGELCGKNTRIRCRRKATPSYKEGLGAYLRTKVIKLKRFKKRKKAAAKKRKKSTVRNEKSSAHLELAEGRGTEHDACRTLTNYSEGKKKRWQRAICKQKEYKEKIAARGKEAIDRNDGRKTRAVCYPRRKTAPPTLINRTSCRGQRKNGVGIRRWRE